MRKKKVNIRVSKNSLYLDYFFNGERKREFLNLSNTPQNYENAEKLAREKEDFLNAVQNKLIEWERPNEKLDSDFLIQKVKIARAKKLLKFNLSDGLEQFLKDNPKKKKNKDVYSAAVKSFVEYFGTDHNIKDINKEVYQKYKDDLLLKKSYSTARTYINYIRMLFDYFKKTNKYLEDNPFIKLKDRPKQKIRTVTDKHWEIIYPYVKERNLQVSDFIYLLKLTGFRRDELLKQKWSDIVFDDDIMIVTTYKDNEREDIFPLKLNGGRLKKHFQEMYERRNPESDNLFDLTEEYARKFMQKCIKEINEEKKKNGEDEKSKLPLYTLHDLRRTFCSYYATLLTPSELMKLARHKKIETTMKYYVAIDIKQIADKTNT